MTCHLCQARTQRGLAALQSPHDLPNTDLEQVEWVLGVVRAMHHVTNQLGCHAGIPYELLNAKPENVERESEIVAQSGRRGAVTIATNMAGRGTHILLGGNPEYMARVRLSVLL